MVFRNEEVKIQNKELKRRIVEVSYKLGLSHLGSNLTAVDIIDEIYKSKKPDEKFVLSAGHAHLAHAVVMEKYGYLGYLGTDAGDKLNRIPNLIKEYGIHCDRKAGCDASTGSLGHGLPISLGMALSNRSKNVYCLISDGEWSEGSIQEALRIAYEQGVDNLKIYLNFNSWGAYKFIDTDLLFAQVETNNSFSGCKINIRQSLTGDEELPAWLYDQEAHYRVLDEKSYNELMEVLR